jgi:predicted nucleotidyltransferase component of viral defense system
VILKEEILERARSWNLRADVVEKDYVLGWLLAALSRNDEIRNNWVFKGGTCLKKCFFETYRFSEDLDFSLRSTAAYSIDALVKLLGAVALDAHELSGIDFPPTEIKIEQRHNK